MLTQDQIIELKEQLSEQIQHLPEAQKEEAQEQIDNLSPEALETMVKQQSKGKKSPLRMIIDGEIPAKIIDENKYALAVVEIRPVAKGHIMILPREKVVEKKHIPPQVFSLAQKTAKRISRLLKPKGVEIQTETKFEEQIINVMPYYDKPVSITSPRYEAKEQELEEIHKALKIIKKPKVIKINKNKPAKAKSSSSQTIILKRRIP